MSGWQLAGLTVTAQHPGLVAHGRYRGSLWATRGRQVLARDRAGPFRPIARVSWAFGATAGRLPWLSQAARLGVHGVLPLASGTLLAVVRGRLLRRPAGSSWRTAMRFVQFNKPTRTGLCADADGRVYLAQYALNPDRALAIHLWRSDDDGQTFGIAHRFAPGANRHIHFVQLDPLDGSVWIGTGDSDHECALYRSTDCGHTFDEVGGGDQRWRAIAVAFLPDAVVWGTDAGRDAPHFSNVAVRLDRKTGLLHEVAALQGPVHGVTATAGGDVLLATGLEGGRNERDDRVHIWRGKGGSEFTEVASMPAGWQPKRVQYPVAHFVPGQAQSSDEPIAVVLRGVRGMALGTVEVRLV